jgi:acyl-CoA thioester hydrolase
MSAAHEFSFDVRIAYADTDRMGVVYYGNYLTLFERGRTELMRNIGVRYRDLEEHEHVYLPAAEAHIKYLAPAKYDDLIRVTTRIKELRGASVEFEYVISDVETGKPNAIGTTLHPFVDKTWKPVRVPASVRAKVTGA